MNSACEYSSGNSRLSPQVRIIPLQLQRLFAQLLLLDQEAASTIDLTDSFGWTSDEVRRCQQGGFKFCLMSFNFVSGPQHVGMSSHINSYKARVYVSMLTEYGLLQLAMSREKVVNIGRNRGTDN